ncbi:MAG: hypothetical protein M0P20_00880 [Methanocorpusculum sp.]|nr:hypothetical protein [Methanocorpusculum sp.]
MTLGREIFSKALHRNRNLFSQTLSLSDAHYNFKKPFVLENVREIENIR